MNVLFIGIDPGVTGAAGFLHCHRRDTFVSVKDLPVTTSTFLANQSKSLDIPALAEIIAEELTDQDYVVFATEQMQGMGFKTPAKILTMLAEMAGALEATIRTLCWAYDIPLFIRKYQPKAWTHWMFPDNGDRKNRKAEAKTESLEKAKELFPSLQSSLTLKKHHDRAEAMLLAFTALAETQGCVIESKLMKFGNLVDIYLAHSQDTKCTTAKITDIIHANILHDAPLLKEIERKQQQ